MQKATKDSDFLSDCLGRIDRLTLLVHLGGNREVYPFFCPITWDTLQLFANFLGKVLVVSKTFATFVDV